jgi:hypothetical protein
MLFDHLTEEGQQTVANLMRKFGACDLIGSHG